jgi:hypothetical protein
MMVGGKVFDSRHEGRRFIELRIREMRGEITDLQTQVKFELIPAVREPDTIGKRGGVKKGKLIERGVDYYADFVYTETASGRQIVEDAKSSATRKKESYIIKRKLMLFLKKIRIIEV